MSLHIAEGLDLPDDFVTKTTGILAQRRKGKTYAACVIAEELVTVGAPWVAIDPTGAWWGLRAGADGSDRGGLPVVILGGQHGDVPLDENAGKLVAELVVDEPGWYVLDLSLFESKEAERRFATAFAERLYRRKGQPNSDFALHLFIDEADIFVPQRVPSGDTKMLGAFEAIVRRGGLRGIGTTLISQRAAVVNKNVLEQLDMLIALRTVGPNDQKAIREYMRAQGTDEEMAELMGSLAGLELGEAWFWEPGEQLFQRARVRERRTFNSSATPRAGEQRVEPDRLAVVDLDALKDAMAATIEKAEADDPAKLRARIRELERELRARPTVEPERVEVEVPVEVPVISDAVKAELTGVVAPVLPVLIEVRDLLRLAAGSSPVPSVPPAGARGRAKPSAPAFVPRPPAPPPDGADPLEGITGGAKRMLVALATWSASGLTRSQLGTQAKVKKSGGTFGTYLGRLQRNGLITVAGDHVAITELGLEQVGGERPPADPSELRSFWRERFTGGARRMFDLLVDAYPDGFDREELADRANVTLSGGTFGTYLSRLKSNECATDDGDLIRAHPNLFFGDC